jgi:hypothetical protein
MASGSPESYDVSLSFSDERFRRTWKADVIENYIERMLGSAQESEECVD